MPYRTRLLLDGQWKFWTDPDARYSATDLPSDSFTSMLVPSTLQSKSPELANYSGPAWYQRTFDVPPDWGAGNVIILGVGAADYRCQVWVNGYKAGEHEGGYLPFEFDITRLAQPGENMLTIRVDDPPEVFAEAPHGKQGWYGPLSGIWQSVWVERRSSLYLRSLEIQPDLANKVVQAQVNFTGPVSAKYQITASVCDPDGEVVASSRAPLAFMGGSANLAMEIANPKTWSLEQPNLYTLEVLIQNGGGPVDMISKTFGFRTIEAKDGKLYLNGKPVYLRAALDQDYYPNTIYTTPSVEFLEDEFRKAKELGLNCLRCHIKAADPRYYETADRLGLLVWTEIPNWSVLTETSAERGRALMRGILERDGHHPSIIIWTIINEDWGTDLVNEASHRAWLKDTYHWLKSLDPTRLVVDNSPCLPNFHVETDLEDFHYYRGIPDHRHDWDTFIKTFAGRPGWTFSPKGDAVRKGAEPLIVSEFGNWGLPDADQLRDEQGHDPWWFETGFEWSGGVVFPHGVRERFRDLGLERVFGSWKNFITATQRQEYLALKYQIESMRRQPEIQGYVITELTDVHWECNGLLDMARNTKAFHNELHTVNADTVIVPAWEQVAYWSGDTARIELYVAHGCGHTLEDVELRWRLEGSDQGGRMMVPTLEAGNVIRLAGLEIALPAVEAPGIRRLTLALLAPNGSLLASNALDLTLYPSRDANHLRIDPRSAPLYVTEKRLSERLKELGYRMADDLLEARVAIAPKADQAILSFLQKGGNALLLADRAQSGLVLPGIKIERRQGNSWDGDWASTFTWLSRKGPLSAFPGGPLIDHSFDCVIPENVVTGFKSWEYLTLVHSGLFVGWVHKPAVIIGERRYGRGKAVLNTYRLDDTTVGYDPTATMLMDSLIEMAAC